MVWGRSIEKRISRGVNFCHVRRVEAGSQFNEAIVEGNHWNMGAIPALVMSAIEMNIGERGDQGVAQRAGPIKNKTDPAAWAMKYLQALLVFSDMGPKG